MCARFTLKTPKKILEERFKAAFQMMEYVPRYNAAPDQDLWVITSAEPKKIRPMSFGMRPTWWKEKNRALVNVRDDNLKTKKTFRHQFESQRCLVLADGFYEWKAGGKYKTPYYITLKTGEPFAFAGLWDENTDEKGEKFKAFSIITTKPNALVGKIHDRMPVILDPKEEKLWLNSHLPVEKLFGKLNPYPAGQMQAYIIDRKVNNPQIDDSELILKA